MKSKVMLLAILLCGVMSISGCGGAKTEPIEKEESKEALSSSTSENEVKIR